MKIVISGWLIFALLGGIAILGLIGICIRIRSFIDDNRADNNNDSAHTDKSPDEKHADSSDPNCVNSKKSRF